MRKTSYLIAVLGLALLFGTAWWYTSGQSSRPGAQADPASESADDYVRVDAGEGGVQVSATLLVPSVLYRSSALADQVKGLRAGEELAVSISLNTHSVDLSGYDLVSITSLETPDGPVRPLRYLAQQDDIHHRVGTMVFPVSNETLEQPGDLSLVMRGLAGVVDRSLSWSLPAG
jgi:hypothetical protein